MTITNPRGFLPGDIGFAMIPGRVGGWVNLGQALLRDSCRWTHTFLILDAHTGVEAMPGGAVLFDPSARLDPRRFAYARLPLDRAQRETVAKVGRSLEGVPYSFLDYYALAAWEWSLPGRSWARKRVTDSGHMICSQLVDHALCASGFHLFDDGRLSQDVTPGDVFYATEALGWTL